MGKTALMRKNPGGQELGAWASGEGYKGVKVDLGGREGESYSSYAGKGG